MMTRITIAAAHWMLYGSLPVFPPPKPRFSSTIFCQMYVALH